MSIKFDNFKVSVGPEAIELFQRFYKFKFPKPYKAFLLKQNGGTPEKNIFNFANGGEASIVRGFFKINSSNSYDDLLSSIENYRNRMPNYYIPIADDTFGNNICLAIKGQNYGKVYFWDHENEVDDGETPTMDNMSLLANNFDDFLNSLYSDTEV